MMNKSQFLEYFKQKKTYSKEDSGIVVTKVVNSATSDISNAELSIVEDEIKNSVQRPSTYQKAIPERIKREVGTYADGFRTAAAMKKLRAKYSKYSFNRTTINSWKKKFKDADTFEKAGRPNLLDSDLLKKVKDIAIRTRMAGGVINRKLILNIAKGVVKANNPSCLKEFGGTLDLTDRWARNVLHSMEWVKRKGTTGKIEPSLKFTFQRAISTAVFEHDIPTSLIVNLDQTPLSYVSPGKYTFNLRGAKNVPIKGVDDKRQITVTFAVTLDGRFSLSIRENLNTAYQSMNSQSLSRSASQKITGPIQKNPFSSSKK